MKSKHLGWAGAFAFLLLYINLALAVPYMPVSTEYANYSTSNVEVYNSTLGTDYGKAKIERHEWFNPANDYWYYAFRIYDNQAGVTNNRADDYHFGHTYNSGTYTPINSFNISLGLQIPKITGDELFVTSTLAGSSTGGNAWAPLINELWDGSQWVITGVDWSATRGGGETIKPTQWSYKKIKGKWSWGMDYAGDTSRTDSRKGQYFEIASKLQLGPIDAHVSNGLVSSDVTVTSLSGSAVVPEPATCLLLGLGFAGLTLSRRKIEPLR